MTHFDVDFLNEVDVKIVRDKLQELPGITILGDWYENLIRRQRQVREKAGLPLDSPVIDSTIACQEFYGYRPHIQFCLAENAMKFDGALCPTGMLLVGGEIETDIVANDRNTKSFISALKGIVGDVKIRIIEP